MRLHCIYFTNDGRDIAVFLKNQVISHDISLFCGFGEEKTPLSRFCQEGFENAEGLIFISATGIAVRGIAPFIQSKVKDPAVLVVDDQKNFVISLLSGHFGQANQLTLELSFVLDNIPVITTATDNKKIFAIDTYAKEEGFSLIHPEGIKVFSGRLLRGEKVKVFSEFPSIILGNNMEITTNIRDCHVAFSRTPQDVLTLIPQEYYIGIGCKRGTEAEKLEIFVKNWLKKLDISQSQIKGIGSVDLKKEEEALVLLAEKMAKTFVTFSSEDLQKIPGEFTASDFVLQTTGTDNVCERSVIACGAEEIVQKKVSEDGMTFALGKKSVKIVLKGGN